MATLRTLKSRAKETAVWRGHELSKFHTFTSAERIAVAHCLHCPASVTVNVAPKPNEIDIGGDAMAINCEPSKWRKVDPNYSGSHATYASYPGFSFERVS